MPAEDKSASRSLIAAAVGGIFLLLCLGLVAGAVALFGKAGYGEGYAPYQDAQGRFRVEGPKNYSFTTTQNTEHQLHKEIHEAQGYGKIDDFFVIVCSGYGKLSPGSSDEELLDVASSEFRSAFEGSEKSKEVVERKSGPASRRNITGKDNGRTITVILEEYMDGDDLVVVGIKSSDADMVDDPVGKHFLDSFTIANKRTRETVESPAAPANTPNPGSRLPTMMDVLRDED